MGNAPRALRSLPVLSALAPFLPSAPQGAVRYRRLIRQGMEHLTKTLSPLHDELALGPVRYAVAVLARPAKGPRARVPVRASRCRRVPAGACRGDARLLWSSFAHSSLSFSL